MANLILPHRWRQQPKQPVLVSPEWRRGLAHALLPLPFPYDAAGGQPNADTTVGDVSDGQNARKFTRGSSQFITMRSRAVFSGFTSMSGFVRLRMDNLPAGLGTNENFISCRTAGNAGASWSLANAAGTAPNRTFRQHFVIQGVAAYDSTVNQSGFDGLWGTLGFTANSNGTVRFYANGLFVDAVSVGAFTDPGAQDALVGAAGPDGSAGQFFDGWMAANYCWVNRIVTDAEHKALAANPWQIFRPLRRRIYVHVAAAVVPEVVTTGGGRMPKRRRYLLPNDVLVWATTEEIVEILQPYIEAEKAEQPKPKTKKQKRKAKHEPFVPIEIHFEPIPDFQVETFRPVLPKRAIWVPDPEKLAQEIARLKRKRKITLMLLLG